MVEVYGCADTFVAAAWSMIITQLHSPYESYFPINKYREYTGAGKFDRGGNAASVRDGRAEDSATAEEAAGCGGDHILALCFPRDRTQGQGGDIQTATYRSS